MKTASDLYTISGLMEECADVLEKFKAGDDYIDWEGRYHLYFMDTVSPGSSGTYQPSEIAEFFDLMPSDFDETIDDKEVDDVGEWFRDDEFFWDSIDSFTDEVANDLNKALKEEELPGHLFFGHNETDGDYGLFYSVDADEIEGEEEPKEPEEEAK